MKVLQGERRRLTKQNNNQTAEVRKTVCKTNATIRMLFLFRDWCNEDDVSLKKCCRSSGAPTTRRQSGTRNASRNVCYWITTKTAYSWRPKQSRFIYISIEHENIMYANRTRRTLDPSYLLQDRPQRIMGNGGLNTSPLKYKLNVNVIDNLFSMAAVVETSSLIRQASSVARETHSRSGSTNQHPQYSSGPRFLIASLA